MTLELLKKKTLSNIESVISYADELLARDVSTISFEDLVDEISKTSFHIAKYSLADETYALLPRRLTDLDSVIVDKTRDALEKLRKAREVYKEEILKRGRRCNL